MTTFAVWTVWAEGDLHGQPGVTLAPFAVYLFAAAASPTLVVRLAAEWDGMAFWASMAAGAAACVHGFGCMNPVTGDLALPCAA